MVKPFALAELLLAEFAHETATARTHLERLPTSRFEC